MVCDRCPREYRHYDTLLKRKCFRKLQNNVWENKIKWKLIKKADYHCRLKVMKKYMNLWISYVTASLKKQINRETAESYYEEKLKKKAINFFKKNVQLSWLYLKVLKKKMELDRKHKAWQKWKLYTKKRLKSKKIKLLADVIRHETLITRFFYLWSFRLKERQKMQALIENVTEKHNLKLKKIYLRYWKVYKDKKLCKKTVKRISTTYYDSKLLQKCYYFWKKHTNRKALYGNQINYALTFYQNYLLKAFVTKWYAVYEKCTMEKEIHKFSLAVDHHNGKTLKKSFETFLKVWEIKKKIKEKIKLFQNYYIKIYIELWMEKKKEKLMWTNLEITAMEYRELYLVELFFNRLKVEYSARLAEHQKMISIVNYSNAVTTYKTFKSWLEVTLKKRDRKTQMQKGVEFYEEKLKGKTLRKWTRFLYLKSQKKVAIAYYKNVILADVFIEWKNFALERRTKKLEAINLERKNNLKVIKSAFRTWKCQVRAIKDNMDLASNFCDRVRMSKTFIVWKRKTKVKVANKLRLVRNKNIINEILMKNVIFKWYEVYLSKQNIHKKLEEVKNKQNRRILMLYFCIWQKFVSKIKNICEKVENFPKITLNIILEQYMRLMVKALKDKLMFKKNIELAKQIETFLIKRKYLKKWLLFVCWKRETIIECLSRQRAFDLTNKQLNFSAAVGKGTRRQPIIPEYLKDVLGRRQEETFTLKKPINEKLADRERVHNYF